MPLLAFSYCESFHRAESDSSGATPLPRFPLILSFLWCISMNSFFSKFTLFISCLLLTISLYSRYIVFASTYNGYFDFGYCISGESPSVLSTTSYTSLYDSISYVSDYSAPSFYDESFLYNFLGSCGLSSYFYNWYPYNPSFYVNIYCYKVYGNVYYRIDFRKYNYDLINVYRSDFSNFSQFVCDVPVVSSFLNGSSPSFFSLPNQFRLSFTDYSFSDAFPILRLMDNDYGTLFFDNSPYPFSVNVINGDISSYFESFLSSSDQYSFSILLNQFSDSSSFATFTVNLGFQVQNLSNSNFTVIFSSFSVFNFSSDLISFLSSSNSGSITLYRPLLNPSYSSFFSSVFTYGFSFSGDVPVTPTPIPTQDWITPTPFPTVTPVPVTLTPIPQYLNPDLDIDSTEVKSALSGYLSIIDDTFVNFPIFALGSQILSYFYSFSPYFSFILLIPAICLISYAIGRLNQK